MELQTANLGKLVNLDMEGVVTGPGRVVYVKSAPNIAAPILLSMGLYEMCTPDDYNHKYYSKVPAKISLATRRKLLKLGAVTPEQMNR